jgi:hypothetical protein
MRLSRDEEAFLRAWIYDEAHYQEGIGSAKRLQLQHGIKPADLAMIIAATIPDPGEQAAAGFAPSTAEVPVWPWSEDAFRERLAEARAALGQR